MLLYIKLIDNKPVMPSYHGVLRRICLPMFRKPILQEGLRSLSFSLNKDSLMVYGWTIKSSGDGQDKESPVLNRWLSTIFSLQLSKSGIIISFNEVKQLVDIKSLYTQIFFDNVIKC